MLLGGLCLIAATDLTADEYSRHAVRKWGRSPTRFGICDRAHSRCAAGVTYGWECVIGGPARERAGKTVSKHVVKQWSSELILVGSASREAVNRQGCLL